MFDVNLLLAYKNIFAASFEYLEFERLINEIKELELLCNGYKNLKDEQKSIKNKLLEIATIKNENRHQTWCGAVNNLPLLEKQVFQGFIDSLKDVVLPEKYKEFIAILNTEKPSALLVKFIYENELLLNYLNLIFQAKKNGKNSLLFKVLQLLKQQLQSSSNERIFSDILSDDVQEKKKYFTLLSNLHWHGYKDLKEALEIFSNSLQKLQAETTDNNLITIILNCLDGINNIEPSLAPSQVINSLNMIIISTKKKLDKLASRSPTNLQKASIKLLFINNSLWRKVSSHKKEKDFCYSEKLLELLTEIERLVTSMYKPAATLSSNASSEPCL